MSSLIKSSSFFSDYSFFLLILLVPILFPVEIIQAQNNSGTEVFRHITPRDGFSNYETRQVAQDRYGNMWFGGIEGLDRYDGIELKKFVNRPGDDTSLKSDFVNDLFLNSSGELFVATIRGIQVFDFYTETFQNLLIKDENFRTQSTSTIVEEPNGTLWLSGNSKLYSITKSDIIDTNYKVEHFEVTKPDSSRLAIFGMVLGRDGNLWLGTSTGLYIFDIESKTVIEPEERSDPLGEPLTRFINTQFIDSQGIFWFSSRSELWMWPEDEHYPVKSTILDELPLTFANLFITHFSEDADGTYWLGTNSNGLIKYNPKTRDARIIQSEDGVYDSLLNNEILALFPDSEGNIWISHYDAGFSVMYNHTMDYTFHRMAERRDLANYLNAIMGVNVDDVDNIWLLTLGGLVKINPHNEERRIFNLTMEERDPDDSFGIYVQGKIVDLVADKKSVHTFNRETGATKELALPEPFDFGFNFAQNEHFFLFSQDDETKLLLVDQKSLEISYLDLPGKSQPDSVRTTYILESGTDNKFHILRLKFEPDDYLEAYEYIVLDSQTLEFTQYDVNLSEDNLLLSYFNPFIEQTDDNNFLLITKSGLISLDPKTSEFEVIFEELPNVNLSSIVAMFKYSDDEIFLTTRNNIIKYNLKNQTHQVFSTLHQRKPEQLMFHGILSTGDIALAGYGGVMIFDPNQEIETHEIKYIIISELSAGPNRFLLDGISNYQIPNSERNLTIRYKAINYRNPNSVNYRYKLEGYSDEWISAGTQRSVQFANLSPGNYTFYVQASSEDGSFGEKYAELSFKILPPWWRTWFAYVSYLLMFIVGVWFVDQYQRKRLLSIEREKTRERELEQAKEIEKAYRNLEVAHSNLKAAQEQLVQQEKLASLGQLTAGIAHEIKNPLNFVNNFSEVSIEMIEEARDELANVGTSRNLSLPVANSPHQTISEILDDIEANLRKIHEHGSRADSIVKSMLMHSRGGSGNMEPTDLNAMVKEYVNLAFHGMRAGKEPIDVDIDLQLDESVGDVPLIAEDFSRVILNLCNNGFDAMREKLIQNLPADGSQAGSKFKIQNYSPKLTVRTKQQGSKILIEIEDNGPGIPDNIKDKILQPFFTTKKGTQGTGLGLSITHDIVKAHGGEMKINSTSDPTCICVNIPTNKKII